MTNLRRFVTALGFFTVFGLGCAHCGSAYPYRPVPDAQNSNYVGSTTTSVATAGSTTGATDPNATGGAASGGGTSGSNTTPAATPFSLTVQGQGFSQENSDPVSLQLLDAGGQKTGSVATSNVQQNGEFLLTVGNAIDANTAYQVAIFVASAGDTHCNWKDQQFLMNIPAGDGNVLLQVTPQRNHANVCNNF